MKVLFRNSHLLFLFPLFYLCSTHSLFLVLVLLLQAMIRSQLHLLFLRLLFVSIREDRAALKISLAGEFYFFEVRIIYQDHLFFCYFGQVGKAAGVEIGLSIRIPVILNSFGHSFIGFFLCYVDVIGS